MADGIREIGFRLRAAALVGLSGTQEEEDSTAALMRDMAQHLSGMMMMMASDNNNDKETFKDTVQRINTLFEIAATLTTLADSDSASEREKIDALYQHAVEGLDLIGGEE
jgi:hypothetical protein